MIDKRYKVEIMIEPKGISGPTTIELLNSLATWLKQNDKIELKHIMVVEVSKHD